MKIAHHFGNTNCHIDRMVFVGTLVGAAPNHFKIVLPYFLVYFLLSVFLQFMFLPRTPMPQKRNNEGGQADTKPSRDCIHSPLECDPLPVVHARHATGTRPPCQGMSGCRVETLVGCGWLGLFCGWSVAGVWLAEVDVRLCTAAINVCSCG